MNALEKKAERRLVTVLFADLSNFTSLCHEIDPEESVKIANIAFERINKVVSANGGMIHKYEGDAVMCLYGFPVSHEDAPERAVKTGLELLGIMPDINESVHSQTGIKSGLDLHVGIHSGPVVVSEVGSNEKKEYTVMGNTVNLASRLKDAAHAGTVLVSTSVYRTTRYLIEYQDEGMQTLKGIDTQVKLYRPVKLREKPEPKRGIRGLHSPLVGRDSEFEAIKEKIRGLEQGSSGVSFITGDAGIGKSRIWQEIKDFIEYEDVGVRILEGQCIYHGEHLAYWPVLQILDQIFAITDKDNPDAIKAKITEKVSGLLPQNWKDIVPYVGQLFSLKFSDELDEKIRYLSPRDLQLKILGSITTLLEAMAEQIPVLLAIEDYHWIDPASLAFIRFAFGSRDTRNVMLLCLSRDGMDEEFQKVKEELRTKSQESFTEIKLNPLDRYSSLELTYNLLEIPGFSKDFKNKVLAKAEGNPFFLEEIINSLIDSGVIVFEDGMWLQQKKLEEIKIPDTIQLVIASRLDRLEENLRSVLQMASVIGRTFYKSILAEIHEDKKRLIGYLETLEEYKFILHLLSSGQSAEDVEYMFKHPLIQQVTYTSLLKAKRRKLHKLVAESMELLYKDRIEDFVELIAQQYASSDDFDKAVEWLLRAGKKAKSNYANENALEYYRSIVSIITENAISNPQALIASYESMADICKNTGRNAESIENYTKIFDITEDGLIRARITRKIADTYQKQSMYAEALEHLEKSGEILDEVRRNIHSLERKDDYFLERYTLYHHIAWVNYLKGDFAEAKAYSDKSFGEIEKVEDRKEKSIAMASALNVQAAVMCRTGETEQSYECYMKAEKIFEEEGDLSGLGTIYNNCVNYFAEKGDYISCIRYLEKSIEIATKTGNALGEAISSFNLGHEYLNLGNYVMARDYLERYQKLNKLINNRLGEGWAAETYARFYEEQGMKDKAMESANLAIEIFREVKSEIKEMGAKLTKADLLTESGAYEEAQGLLCQVEEYARKNSVTDYIVAVHISRGAILERKDPEAALAEYHKALDLVKRIGWVSGLSEIYFNIGRMMESMNKEGYSEYYENAKKTLRETAEKITDEDLRHSFLNKPFNKRIMSA